MWRRGVPGWAGWRGLLPRGVPHAHRRVVPQAGRLIFMTSPGGLEGFFRILAEASRAGDLGEAAYAQASHA